VTTPVPPHSAQDEEALLGACFLNPAIIPKVAQILIADDFYREANGLIYGAILECGKEANPVSVANWLKKYDQFEKAGGENYIFSLCRISTAEAWQYHAGTVKDLSFRRKIINGCFVVSQRAYQWHEPTDAIISDWKESARSIDADTHGQDDWSNKNLYTDIYENLNNENFQPGFKFGIQNIDDYHRIEDGCVTVIAAESGTGKSAFCLQVSDYVSRAYGPVLYFSLESTRQKLGIRQIARYSNIALTRLNKRHFNNDSDLEQIHHALDDLIDSRLTLIDNTKYNKIETLASFCESWALDKPLKLVVIDYLQLMTTGEKVQSRHLEISNIVRKTGFLAKQLDVPVLLVSSLRKDLGGRKPTVDDLKESGDIRYHADNILFLHSKQKDETVYPVECYLGKGKDQEQFRAWLEFNGHYQRFSDGDEPEDLNKLKPSWQDKA